jgi:hypothetical protein
MGSAKRAVKVLDFDLHGSPYTHTKANVALNTIFLVLSIEQNGPAEGIRTNCQNTSGNVFSKVLPFERNGGAEGIRTRCCLR